MLVGRGEPARVADEVARRNDDPVPLHELRAVLDLAGSDLGSLEVLHNRHVAARLLRGRSDDLGVLQVHRVVAVAEVEPRHVYADPDQGPYALRRGGRWPQSCDYLRPAHTLNSLLRPHPRVERSPTRVEDRMSQPLP